MTQAPHQNLVDMIKAIDHPSQITLPIVLALHKSPQIIKTSTNYSKLIKLFKTCLCDPAFPNQSSITAIIPTDKIPSEVSNFETIPEGSLFEISEFHLKVVAKNPKIIIVKSFKILARNEIVNSGIINLKKFARDEFYGLRIYGFLPLVERISNQFSQILRNEKIICSMSALQLAIIQKLLDFLMYGGMPWIEWYHYNKESILDELCILGLFKNGEFIERKRKLIDFFVKSITLNEFISQWEQIDSMLKICNEQFGIQNEILEHLNNYCLEFASIQLRTKEGNDLLSNSPIIINNSIAIFSKMSITEPNAINIDEMIEFEHESIESLFNDEESSDVKIKMGQETFLYCHKTILSSFSTFFSSLFESGSSFSDFTDNVFTPDETEDLELLEIAMKSIYGIQPNTIDSSKISGLLDLAVKHEIQNLVNYCTNFFPLSIENYFEIVELCGNYLEFPVLYEFFDKIVKFGMENRKVLFADHHLIEKLPGKLWQTLFFKFSQMEN